MYIRVRSLNPPKSSKHARVRSALTPPVYDVMNHRRRRRRRGGQRVAIKYVLYFVIVRRVRENTLTRAHLYTHEHTYVLTHAHTLTHTHACTHGFTLTRSSTCVYVCVRVYVYTCTVDDGNDRSIRFRER